MTLLCVGLQDLYPKCGQELGEDDASDLVNRLGKNLETIGQLDEKQRAEVLKRAKCAGFTRWHSLIADDGSPFDSNYRVDCHTSFIMTFGLWERVPGTHALVLDTKDLSVLVRRFGADLEQLQKLPRSHIHTVGIGLDHAGFVNGVLLNEATQTSYISAMENTGTGDLQPAPFLPPQSPGDPSCSIHDASSTLHDPQTRNNYQSFLGDSIDFSMENPSFQPPATPSERPSPVSETVLGVTPYTPGNPFSLHSIGLESYASPGEDIYLGSKQHTMEGPHHPISNADEGASCYPTPPSYDNETSTIGVLPFSAESGCITVSQTKNTNEHANANAAELSASMALAHRVQNVKRLLFSCDSTLNEIQVQKILLVSANPLLADNLEQTLQPLLDHWNLYDSLEVSALGLPVQWRGIGAAANYLRILDCQSKRSILTSFGQVLLYFNYEELCRDQNKLTHRTSLKADKTDVLNYILEAYHDDPNLDKNEQFRRNRITGYHLRRGKWWWRIASTLGVGILLLGNASLVHDMCVKGFTDAQVRAFIILAVKTQLGSIGVFKATEPMAKCILFGHESRDPHAFLFDPDFGLLRPKGLARVRDKDKQALSNELSQPCWEAVDVVKNATRKMTDDLGWEFDK